MSVWTYRQATPDDAEMFAWWVKNNPLIDPIDVARTIHGQNPTVVFLVACCDGEPQGFVPVYVQFHIAHVAFNPKANAAKKMKVLAGLKDFIVGLAVQFGIREVTTLSRGDYPIAQWALRNGFERDDREVFTLDINRLLPAKTDTPK